MKTLFKVGLVALGLILAVVATTATASASKGGKCLPPKNTVCMYIGGGKVMGDFHLN